jgi:endo-1,3-1,4-beta-glycanase ExoK
MPSIPDSRGRSVALLTAILAILSGGAALADEQPSFLDDFATFDRTRWFASDGWYNGNWQNCTWSKRQVALGGGVLTLSFARQRLRDRDYVCGEIQTHKRYGFGTYEIRLRSDRAVGLNSAFFTYVARPHHDEIDFEILMKDPSRMTVNTFVAGKPRHGASFEVPGGTDGGFNDYAFVWEKDRLRWYLNGRLVHEVSEDEASLPQLPQKIYVSIWGSDTFTEWLGRFEDPGRKVTLEVERVAFTRLGDSCQFPDSVACALD